MSYQMTHLEVAYRLLDKYKWIEVRPDFLLGAIAPDAVHFHEEYYTKLKEQSHLWDCGPRWGITLDSFSCIFFPIQKNSLLSKQFIISTVYLEGSISTLRGHFIPYPNLLYLMKGSCSQNRDCKRRSSWNSGYPERYGALHRN